MTVVGIHDAASCSDFGTDIVVETGLAFDFAALAWSIRRLIVGALHDREEVWDIFFAPFIASWTGCGITKRSSSGSSGSSSSLCWLSQLRCRDRVGHRFQQHHGQLGSASRQRTLMGPHAWTAKVCPRLQAERPRRHHAVNGPDSMTARGSGTLCRALHHCLDRLWHKKRKQQRQQRQQQQQ